MENSPSADGWCQLTKEPPIRETHQYKLIQKDKLTPENFKEKREKAADPNDFFIMFSIYPNSLQEQELPKYSGLVVKSNFKDYYGPFSGRVFYMINSYNFFQINSATRDQLKMVPGIGDQRAQKILQTRPFSNLEDCSIKTGIPQSVLQVFIFPPQ